MDGTLFGSVAFSGDFDITEIGNGYPHSTAQLSLIGLLADLRFYDSVPSQADIDAVVALGSGNAISITSINDDQFFQRPDTGNLSVTVSGDSSLDEVIQYRVDSGTWQTLATASGGTYSGSVSVPAGNLTLEVRLTSDNATTSSVTVHVGDAFAWFGQSNPDGRLNNSQPYTGSLGYWIYDEDDSWIAGVSGYESGGPTGGAIVEFSVLPRLASLIEASTGVPVAFICQTLGGTGITTGPWDSNPPGSQYTKAVAAINESGINGLRAALLDTGESDAGSSAVTSALMQATVESLHDDLQTATGLSFPLILSITGTHPTALAGKLDEVRQGQIAAVDNRADIYFGVVGYDRANLHWETDPEAIVYAGRYVEAIDAALFGGTGLPPRLVSAVVESTTVTLTYDRDLETAVSYTANAWTFDDDGSAITVTAAAKQGDRGVVLTLATAPASSTLSVYLGSSNAAAGDDVPRGLGGQAALPGMMKVIPTGHAPVWGMVRAKQIQRVMAIN